MLLRRLSPALAAGILLLAWSGAAHATSFTLADKNATVEIETVTLSGDAGMLSWIVDDQEQLARQWFYIRIDDSDIVPVETLGLVGEFATDTNPFVDGSDDTLGVLYGNPAVEVELSFNLRGGAVGSGVADVAETVLVSNIFEEALDISIIQYVDLDLDGSVRGDTVEVVNPNLVRQTDSPVLFEEAVTPEGDTAEVGFVPDVIDGIPDGLDEMLGPIGPANVAFAFQWDFRLDPGKSFVISKDKRIGRVPEPGPAALGALGALGLAMAGRRRMR